MSPQLRAQIRDDDFAVNENATAKKLPKMKSRLRRVFGARIFKILSLLFMVTCLVSGIFAVYFYKHYSRIIDRRLNSRIFQNTARIYGPSSRPVTMLSGESRVKRRVVEFKEIPKVLVDAVLAGEDQGFFGHHGLAPVRIGGAFISNLQEGHRLQGASTITQQLARNLFLTAAPVWRRKVSEACFALILELRLTKEQIFALYASEVYLGQRGTFAIHGFSEGAKALFGKDLSDLTLPEAATLAGIIPAPNAYSPGRHPDRASFRRNLILKAMWKNGAITTRDYDKARQARLVTVSLTADATEAPYLVDYIRDQLLKDYTEEELMNGGLNVYTTLDPGLQKAAVESVAKGLLSVEVQLQARRKKKQPATRPGPQAGLIALDPRTGAIKAMVGGSDYASSQYNRITHAFRQPGSVFKPFVYAAALETSFDVHREDFGTPDGSGEESPNEESADEESPDEEWITPVTTVLDAPGSFFSGGVPYEPSNYGGKYHGPVTLRTALEHSLNLATLRIADRIGFGRVATMARRMGLNKAIKGYPSVALGAFEVTPLELAGAYTAFANEGKRAEPHGILRVTNAEGLELKTYIYKPRRVLRPEIAYLMTHLMEGVINHGTGAGVRTRGFKLPAAGKTGTSRDGWFVGYTRDLLVIAWVGFDDNRDLGLEGARSALPIWTDFMLKAYQLHPVRNPASMSFTPPPGVEMVTVDGNFKEAFIVGTAPNVRS
jgi:penicillin-binding protein 1B